jgi:hypothetical protein
MEADLIHDWFITILNFVLGPIFPVRLPGKIRDWDERIDPLEFGVGSRIGVPRRKKYRDAIERHWAEEKHAAARPEVRVYVRPERNRFHDSERVAVR